MKEPEPDDGTSSDGTDHESCSNTAPSNSKVSSSTNGKTNSAVSVISSPLRRSLETGDVKRSIVSNALAAFGSEVVAAATAATSQLSFNSTTNEANRVFLAEFAGTRSVHSGTGSNKSSSPDGSNSASPLSLSITKIGPKPRSADSPGSGSTTSTTTSRDKPFMCQICNKGFGYKHVLQNHERTHTGEKPFQCRECLKRFTRDHHLKTHMRLHTGEKPYHCEHCDKDFVQVANLRRHLRVHTGERPYACDSCDSKFSDSNQLKAHKLIHKGEKPFECDKCLGRFRRRHHLMHHKCPKDEANAGKPRRGRRPKAYDQLTPSLLIAHRSTPNSGDETGSLSNIAATVSSSTVALAAAATSSFYQFHQAAFPVPSPVIRSPTPKTPLTPPTPPAAHSGSGPLPHVISSDGTSKSRRKPPHPYRIVSRQQCDRFMNDHNSMQTQPLNMSLSPSYSGPLGLVHRSSPILSQSLSHRSTHQDVLDLSRSRSDVDSEAEAIEEEVMEDDIDDDIESYDCEHYENTTIKTSTTTTITTMVRPMVGNTNTRNRCNIPMLSGNVKLVKDKLVNLPSDVPSDLLLHKRLHLNDNSNDGHGNGGIEEKLGENGAIQLTKAKTTSCS